MVEFILEVLIAIGKFLWQGLAWIGNGIKDTCVWVYKGMEYNAVMIVTAFDGPGQDDPKPKSPHSAGSYAPDSKQPQNSMNFHMSIVDGGDTEIQDAFAKLGFNLSMMNPLNQCYER